MPASRHPEPAAPCLVHGRVRLRSARHSPSGCPDAHAAGAAPFPPAGVAPPTVSTVAIPPGDACLTLSRIAAAAVLATLCTLAPAMIVAVPTPLAAQTMEERARAAAAAARAKSADSDALLQNYVIPGMSGEAIATVDDSKSFTPSLACRKTATLLEILVQPGATGDLAMVRIARDKDFDGSFDAVTTLPVPVSGICANGVIACRPGSWNACRYFRWAINGADDIALAEVEMPALAGCYCVNDSCGANLVFANLPSVLKDLGGGVVGALTTADPRIGIAEARINGPVISYVGAQTTACSAEPEVGQTAYRANPAAISGDAAAAAGTSPVFKALAASPAGFGKAEETRTCTIAREITVTPLDYDDIVTVTGSLQSVTACGEGCRRYRIGGTGDCSAAPPVFTAVFDVRRPERLVSARILGMAAEDWVQGHVNGAIVGSAGKRPWLTEALPSGDCAVEGSWSNLAVHDIAPQVLAGPTRIGARVRGGKDDRWGWVDLEIRVDTACETAEHLVDLCSGYGGDARCRLDSEDVDGARTFRSGVGTGLRPLPQTRTFGTGTCAVDLTRDFFLRKRSYKCVADTGSMPEPDLSRGAYIIDHSTETVLADRVRTADGGSATSTRPFALPDRGSVPECEAICKTHAPKANTDAAPAGVVGAQQNNPVGWDTFYHACTTGSSGASICPTGPGETMVSPCGCLDDFPEAVVMMQTVRLAGADLACTSARR